MRKRLIPLILAAALVLGTAAFAGAVSGCSGCSTARQSIVLADNSGCGSGGSTPTGPANALKADCTRNLQGPNNSPGKVTAYVTVVCGVNLETVTLTVAIWHSGGGGTYVGDAPEKSNTCFSIGEGGCTVTVACTEGPYMASYSMSALIDGKHYSDFDKTSVVTYSAGDCTV
jgi:hypothetical protein